MKGPSCWAVRAVLGLALAAPAGCGRTSLHPMMDDGSSGLGPEVHWDLVPEVGGWREADAWFYEGDQPAGPQPDAGSEAGREAGSETGRDMSRGAGAEVGRDTVLEAGREARLEAGLESGTEDGFEVGHDTSAEVGSSETAGTACVPTSREAHVLHALNGLATQGGLAVYGDRVFAGVLVDDPSGDPTGGEVFSISMSTGISTTFTLDGSYPTILAAQRDALFYIQCTLVQIGAMEWTSDCANVVSVDMQTGTGVQARQSARVLVSQHRRPGGEQQTLGPSTTVGPARRGSALGSDSALRHNFAATEASLCAGR